MFAYEPQHLRCDVRDASGRSFTEACWQADGTAYRVAGFSRRRRQADAALRPGRARDALSRRRDLAAELQPADTFTRKGKICNWDYEPEFREGDFET